MQEPIKEPPPLKRRFQIHLSTAIVLMFVAGGLIWANVTPNKNYGLGCSEGIYHKSVWYGWPFSCIFDIKLSNSLFDWVGKHYRWIIDWNKSVLNLLIALLLVFLVYFLCEWLIRRRAARKV